MESIDRVMYLQLQLELGLINTQSIAERYGHEMCASVLWRHRRSRIYRPYTVNEALNAACLEGDMCMVSAWLAHGAIPAHSRCMISAARGGFFDITMLMLSRGAWGIDEAINVAHSNGFDKLAVALEDERSKRYFIGRPNQPGAL